MGVRPRVLLIGLGLHARRVHYPLLAGLAASGRISLRGVVDRRRAGEEVRAYLADRTVTPRLTLVDDLTPDGRVPAEAIAALDRIVARERVTTVLVATEPLAHAGYAEWAVSRGLHVLVDKPPTARPGVVASAGQARGMVEDFTALAAAADRNAVHAGVLTQRRYHRGYRYMRHLIREVADRTGCLPTSVSVEHADGEWRLPWEVHEQDYHPFNRGYGVLLHSGYHAVDTALWLSGVTDPDRAGYAEVAVTPHFTLLRDMLTALPEARIHALLGSDAGRHSVPEDDRGLGELDARLTLGLRRSGTTPTVLTVAALHTSFSRRGWWDPAGRNLYTGNGRRVHETVSIQQGPFQTIRMHAYKGLMPGEPGAADDRIGGANHWRLQVFRNSSAVPEWATARELSSGELPPDARTARGRDWAWPVDADGGTGRAATGAKEDLVADFLRLCAAGDDGPPEGASRFESDLAGHLVTVAVIGAAYEAWAGSAVDGPATTTVKLSPA